VISRPLPVAILAGGRATRLRPVTESIPKALVDINGEPFIAHQLRLLATRGLRRVVVCAGYLGEMIEPVIGRGEAYAVEVEYSFDGPSLLGTAGALKKASPRLGDAFFVLYGDSYLRCDYAPIQRAFERGGRLGLMTVYRNDGSFDRSNIEFADGSIVAYDKRTFTPRMCHIDYGLGVLDRRALDLVPSDREADLADLYAQLLKTGQLAAYEVRERFYEIGSQAGLAETRRLLKAGARP
jgi:N-acetyl-alpha-D-muramate 1-phosphate uridylyltransferase